MTPLLPNAPLASCKQCLSILMVCSGFIRAFLLGTTKMRAEGLNHNGAVGQLLDAKMLHKCAGSCRVW